MKKIKQIFIEIQKGENLDIYVTLVLAIVVAILGIIGIVGFDVLGATILATLGLLSASHLENRRMNAELITATTKLNTELIELKHLARNESTVTDVLTQGYPDLSQEILLAKCVKVLGIGLSSTSSRYYSQFSQLLRNGGKLKVIATENLPHLIELMAFRSRSARDTETQIHTYQGNLARIKSLIQLSSNPDNVQLRTIPYILDFRVQAKIEP
jgi:hypothetical protein